jgi:hypothetical protein
MTVLAGLLFVALVAIGAGIPLGHTHRPWRRT